MLTDEKLREIGESVALVALISEYVPLRRQGVRFVGLCPFHQEKTPSFGVARGKDFYYCFGCHASGDAISFLRHVEGLAFMEAVEKLAERAGIELPRTDDVGQLAIRRARARRERLAEIMGLAQTFYEEQLVRHAHGPIAQAEIARRQVREDVAQAFHLGYAPAAWDALARHLASKRVNLEEACEVGLIAPRREGGGYYDRFRHRLMFPVADQHGRVIAFSGRALPPPPGSDEPEAPAKYINSPEGPLYTKGHALFGLFHARMAMRKQNQALLCEGNFDLVALHQAGFTHAVAPLGTAFTLEQARLIRRFAEEVVVVFDGDAAGRKATAAAYDILQSAGLRARAVRLPDGQDPDSYLVAHGPEVLAAALDKAPSLLDFLIDEAREHAIDPASKARVIQRLAPYLARVDGLELSHYVEQIARKLLLRSGQQATEHHFANVRAELRRGLAQAQAGARREGRERPSVAATAAAPAPKQGAVGVRPTSELPARQCIALGILLDHPDLFGTPEAERLAGLLTDPDLRAIFDVTARMVERRRGVEALALLEELSDNAARAWLGERLSATATTDLDTDSARRLLRDDALPVLERSFRDEQRARLTREIHLANQSGDATRALELMRRRDELARA